MWQAGARRKGGSREKTAGMDPGGKQEKTGGMDSRGKGRADRKRQKEAGRKLELHKK